MNLDTIVCMDALEFMQTLPSESVNCVVTSPPYNLNPKESGLNSAKGKWGGNRMKDGYGVYYDDMPIDEYIAWQRNIVDAMMRCIPDSGCIFYNHKWRVQDGLLQRLADEITHGFPVRQIIIWNRGSGMNFNATYFCPSYEVIYLIAKDDFKLHNQMSRRQDLWNILPAANKTHPNSFPVALAEMAILAGSDKGDLILDPFMGEGTTAKAAQRLGRHWVGCDIDPKFVTLAQKQLSKPHAIPFEGFA